MRRGGDARTAVREKYLASLGISIVASFFARAARYPHPALRATLHEGETMNLNPFNFARSDPR